MAIKVPSIGQVVQLWQTRSVSATQQYRDGVSQAGSAWQAGVDSGEDNWRNGVATAAAAGAYNRGTSGKAAKYVDKAVNVGATRFGPGVQAATNAYTSGMGKVLAIEAGITLPARMATGSNQGRSSAVADALHQAKLAGQL